MTVAVNGRRLQLQIGTSSQTGNKKRKKHRVF